MVLALGLALGMGIPERADDGSPLTNMPAQNNNRRRLPRIRKAAGRRGPATAAGAGDHLRGFIGSLSMAVPVDLVVGRRIALSVAGRCWPGRTLVCAAAVALLASGLGG